MLKYFPGAGTVPRSGFGLHQPRRKSETIGGPAPHSCGSCPSGDAPCRFHDYRTGSLRSAQRILSCVLLPCTVQTYSVRFVSEKEISEMRPRANAHVGQDTIKSNAAVAREGLVGNLDWSERGTILAEKQSFRHSCQAVSVAVSGQTSCPVTSSQVVYFQHRLSPQKLRRGKPAVGCGRSHRLFNPAPPEAWLQPDILDQQSWNWRRCFSLTALFFYATLPSIFDGNGTAT